MGNKAANLRLAIRSTIPYPRNSSSNLDSSVLMILLIS